MSGNFLETYPNPDDPNENVYLKKWVADYDPAAWSQFQATSQYDNDGGPGTGNSNLLLFMYHPHGRPSGDITWASGTQITPAGGTESDSKEDIYWIQYAPRTSVRGALVGRQLDGFVMAAWKNGGTIDWEFGGSISNAGACVDGGEECLDDLAYILNPAAD